MTLSSIKTYVEGNSLQGSSNSIYLTMNIKGYRMKADQASVVFIFLSQQCTVCVLISILIQDRSS